MKELKLSDLPVWNRAGRKVLVTNRPVKKVKGKYQGYVVISCFLDDDADFCVLADIVGVINSVKPNVVVAEDDNSIRSICQAVNADYCVDDAVDDAVDDVSTPYNFSPSVDDSYDSGGDDD